AHPAFRWIYSTLQWEAWTTTNRIRCSRYGRHMCSAMISLNRFTWQLVVDYSARTFVKDDLSTSLAARIQQLHTAVVKCQVPGTATLQPHMYRALRCGARRYAHMCTCDIH
ncbi:unnamed protein product, partial [Laminaria digitata]